MATVIRGQVAPERAHDGDADASAVLFLDRDGVLNEKPVDGAYITDEAALRVLPGVGRALATLRARIPGLRIAVVTNQRAVARGLLSDHDLEAIHARLEAELARDGGYVDRIETCPHDIGVCRCRKPGLGLFEQALDAWPGVPVSATVVVGDSAIDLIAGSRLGARTYLVGPPERRAAEAAVARRAGTAPDGEASSLTELVDAARLDRWLIRAAS
jgi:D-glycero-D-manno-heptose 1,7-bisphosphate phosphatase